MWEFPLYKIGEPIDWELMESTYDWFRDMKEVPQDAIYHSEGDVMIHTKMVVEALISLPEYQKLSELNQHILFTAALLHDVEKRSTTTTEEVDGEVRVVSPRHAKKGEYTAREILYKDIPTPFYVRERICKLVRHHGLPLWAIEKENPKAEVISVSLKLNTKLLVMLAKADILGRCCDDADECLLKIDLFKELCIENNCWGEAFKFTSALNRFTYLNKPNMVSPDYEPFDNSKFTVYMMCALPASGKDTYIEKRFTCPILSLDDIRRENKIKPTDKKGNGRVIQMGKEQAKVYMRKSESFVFNATNITSDMRSKWSQLFIEYGGQVVVVYIEVPYKQLLSQNNNREYKVPEDIMNKLIGKLEPPTYDEVHDIQYVIHGGINDDYLESL